MSDAEDGERTATEILREERKRDTETLDTKHDRSETDE
jgi:hypothetical protein